MNDDSDDGPPSHLEGSSNGRSVVELSEGAGDEAAHGEPPFMARVFDRIPEQVVPLGAGFLLIGVIFSFVATLGFGGLLVTGRYTGTFLGTGYDFSSVAGDLPLVTVQFLVATVAQALGIYWALNRVRWTGVLLGCLLGSIGVVTIPFVIPAFLLLGLGKHHFGGAHRYS